MDKKGQLAWIEFQFFIYGFLLGFAGGLALVYFGSKKIIPFQVPIVCSSFFLNKKGQLGAIEFKYFIVGFFLGLIGSLVLILLGTKGVLPFKVPFVCPVPVK